MNSLKLYVPDLAELNYRKQLLADPETMTFNRHYDLDLPGYDYESGCLDFAEESWEKWHKWWIGRSPSRFYAYLLDINTDKPVGEVALRYVKKFNGYMINLIIEAKHRGNGFGREALHLISQKAFNELGAARIIDDFSVDRVASYNLFKNFGFEEIEQYNGSVVFFLERDLYYELKNRN